MGTTRTSIIISFTAVALLLTAALTVTTLVARDSQADDCLERTFGLYCPDDPSPVDNPNLDCPERELGLYCPDDPSPVDDPNLDCPERALGLYCPSDPSPVSNPNVDSSGNGSSGGGSGDSSSSEESTASTGRVLGTTTICTRAGDRNQSDFISNQNVPLIVQQIFQHAFGRDITHAESVYWKARARCTKATLSKLTGAMTWHKLNGSTGVISTSPNAIPNADVPAVVARLFRSIFGRDITHTESVYWKDRARSDKRSEADLHGTMQWHQLQGRTTGR